MAGSEGSHCFLRHARRRRMPDVPSADSCSCIPRRLRDMGAGVVLVLGVLIRGRGDFAHETMGVGWVRIAAYHRCDYHEGTKRGGEKLKLVGEHGKSWIIVKGRVVD